MKLHARKNLLYILVTGMLFWLLLLPFTSYADELPEAEPDPGAYAMKYVFIFLLMICAIAYSVKTYMDRYRLKKQN